jgi:chromosome segregation ATPase
MSIDSKILSLEAEVARSREQLAKVERQLGEERRQHQALEATLRAESTALRQTLAMAETDLASLRARFNRESDIYENTKNDLRQRLHLMAQRAERAERVVAQWDELRALLVDDPGEATRRLDAHRDQERW